ncbi:hypothetical protein HYV79_00385 [Candidatus Woesearchaeota archaeon]|nr:hypothetical protein [Candidatus Woesearchaeota archaeon]
MSILQVMNLGLKRYYEVLKLQEELVKKRLENKIPDTLIITEHPPVITFGFNKKWNKMHVSIDELAKRGVEFYYSSRGGGATCLAPGTIVCYTIIDLNERKISIGNYMNLIEKVMLNVFSSYNLKAYIRTGFNPTTQRPYKGVWYFYNEKENKLGAKGVFIKKCNGRDVTMYGFSMYFKKEGLQYFDLIDHCGFKREQVGVISMEDILGYTPNKEDVVKKIVESFKKELNYDFVKNYILKEVACLHTATK